MKKKIGILLLFLVVFSLALIPNKQNAPMLPLEEGVKGIALLGDSTIGLYKDETGISALLEEKMGRPCYNFAIGGTCMASLNREYKNDYLFDEFSVVHLCETLANQDFRTLKNSTEYLTIKKNVLNEVIILLENVDFQKIDYVFLAQGLNDYMIQVSPTSDKEESIYSYEGALIEAITDLKSINPDLSIVIISPTYNLYMEEVKAGTRILTYSFEEYIAVGERVAEECGVEFLNMYEILDIDETNVETYATPEHIHFNEEGRKLYASVLADYIREQE